MKIINNFLKTIFDADNWEEIFDSLSRNKSRTFLTAFGIFWGIFMLILLMGGGRGLETILQDNFAGMSSNSGYMFSNQTSMAYKGFRKGRWWTLTTDDVQRIKNCIPEIEIATPTISTWGGNARANNHSSSVSIMGEFTDYQKVANPHIVFGRALNDVDVVQARKVCVVGKRTAEELFPELGNPANPCGRFLQIDSISYLIVGVSHQSGGINIGSNPQTTVHIPYTTMQKMYNKGKNVDRLCLVAKEQYHMSDVQYKVEKLLKYVHDIHPEDSQAIFKVNAEAIFSMISSLLTGVSILVWMIGLGTLISGAIGVSNIMVVTVKERTTEIGIRRAIGATPRQILGMIMTESIVLTLVAGMTAFSLAVLILHSLESVVKASYPAAEFQISFYLAVGAAILLSVLGAIAGLAPALRAMQIKPVDAMREE